MCLLRRGKGQFPLRICHQKSVEIRATFFPKRTFADTKLVLPLHIVRFLRILKDKISYQFALRRHVLKMMQNPLIQTANNMVHT